MNRAALLPIALLLATGCKPPPEAPDDVGELMIFMVDSFLAEDDDALEVAALSMEAYLKTVDMDAALKARAISPPILPMASVESITHPDTPAADQAPVGVSALSSHSIARHIESIEDPNQVCMASNTTKYSMRTYNENLSCFLDGSCNSLDTVQEVRTESIVKVWLDINSNYRTVTLDDGRTAMYRFEWIETTFDSDNGSASWDQRYGIDFWLPTEEDPDKTYRFYAMWSSVTGLPEGLYLNSVEGGIDEYYTNTDNWFDGVECRNDRDRENDRN